MTTSVADERPLPALDVNSGESGSDLGNEKIAVESSFQPVDDESHEKKGISDTDSENVIINTATDVANHLLSLRDDGEPSLTFRSIVLASLLSAFQAAMNQIYSYKPTDTGGLSTTFIVLVAYFLGNGWALLLPRGDLYEARWRRSGGQGTPPLWIRILSFINSGNWNLKEHAICAITASSASNGTGSMSVFAAQRLFYDLPLNATTIVLATLSISLFGYGLCGLLRPIAVWHIESVYWGNLPVVKVVQGLHWQDVKSSKPMRLFWIGFIGMFFYEFFPAYIFPWLNSVSIPCLAAMRATGSKAAILTNLFGGATNNEGLGLFSLSLDWQYITSTNTSYPLKFQIHSAIGFIICYIAMIGIYYNNVWGSRSLPFMSTRLQTDEGKSYPVKKVFVQGILNEAALSKYGLPRLTGSFAYAMLMANASIGALIAHVSLFWGKDVVSAYKSARQGRFDDRHHAHMAKNYKEAPMWWYAIILIISFILGIVVVSKENVTITPWAYVVSLLLGIVMSPFSVILLARFGNGIATNNLSKMIAGLTVPGRPIGNMYFAAWSHSVIANCVNLSTNLKLGEYLKVPPRVMFVTQVYATLLGAIVNYFVMDNILHKHGDLIANKNGDSSWSGASIQSYNTNATSWALAKYLYISGRRYSVVPLGLAIGAGIVAVHRIFVQFIPKIRGLNVKDINIALLIQYAGFIPYNQSQTCIILSGLLAGFFNQYYIRKYRPNIFRNYSYLITGAWDGGSVTAIFVLSIAVFGVARNSVDFPAWWGNNVNGNLDLCPSPE